MIALDLDGRAVRAAPAIAAPCDCARGCAARRSRAALDGGRARGTTAELRERWRLWLAVRDACPVGRAHRYSDAQIRFHYAGER